MPPPEAECNGLLLVMLDEATVERILADVSDAASLWAWSAFGIRSDA